MPSKVAAETGVQSYCFRGFKDNAKVAALVREIGVSRLELCAVHIDFNQPATFAGVIDTYRKAGVTIASIGVEGFGVDEAAARHRFEFCKASGAKVISCDFNLATTPGCYRLVEKLADQYDVYLAIHNHGGRHWLGCSHMIEHVLGQTSPRVGLCLDTAWCLDSGEEPVAIAEKFAKRLYGVHIKDFVFDSARRPKDVVVGKGNLNLPGLLKVLDQAGGVRSCVLEYEGDVNDPAPALKQCVSELRKA